MIKLSRREKVLVNILNKRLTHEIFFKLCKFTEQWWKIWVTAAYFLESLTLRLNAFYLVSMG